ncbi:MAG: hypothetical protein M5U18_06670 [Dehalococcoidia bacterium]|nr:hypothetical protein [Dehalococcoidia bacterium]
MGATATSTPPDSEQVTEEGGLGRVVAEVANGDAPIVQVVDDAGLAAINADEGHATEHAGRVEPGGEALFDAEAVHEGDDACLRADTGRDQTLSRIYRRRL